MNDPRGLADYVASQAGGLASPTRERPSRHGAILGDALAKLADAGRAGSAGLPSMCATCAFRPGCMTNQMAATGMLALKCAIGIDQNLFACHHGMKDGEPNAICAGYVAALAAPFEAMKALVFEMTQRLDAAEGQPDLVRAAFDVWVATVDPDNRLDDYQRGRLYLKSGLADGPLEGHEPDPGQALIPNENPS